MELKQLMKNYPKSGKVEWIGLREKNFDAPKAVNRASVTPEKGLEGDHYKGKSRKRQVTLIQKEHIDAVSSLMDKAIDPALLRRNVVVSGLNLLSLKDTTFQLGSAILRFTGLCHPCSRMEKNLGEGGYNAMRGHGGITAEVVKDGVFEIGDGLIISDQ
ncbi:hypothetical protein AFM12_01325 [Jiulongibacter sediminis]|uniref:MOSC domain-containing protein n=2 Tax=Jiulongibacter sediminis TaxID=1605367 RepID=A0A0P7BXL6_9BACT|nr:hypothetical protein AFM12_01325 [Jiulongibacter sediminis]TBX26347.1 hypothetical protein TK44_01325 [Jiulongibacter sediminis]